MRPYFDVRKLKSMMKLLKVGFLATLFVASATGLSAQKFGHLNSGNILIEMPDTKSADDKIKLYQDSLVTVGQARAKLLQEEAIAFSKKYKEGGVTPADAQKKQEEFQKRQEDLANFEQQVQDLIVGKREELLGPILQKVQDAINEVGKAGSYTMIFDTSVFNTILFAQESDDITPQVKAKLGLK